MSKFICIDSDGVSLTLGKTYNCELLHHNRTLLLSWNDDGNPGCYSVDRFMSIEDYRDNKINILLND